MLDTSQITVIYKEQKTNEMSPAIVPHHTWINFPDLGIGKENQVGEVKSS